MGIYLDDKCANKGEWAELYVFLRLLGEGKLYAADRQLRRRPSYYVEVLRIIREEIAGQLKEYIHNGSIIDIYIGGKLTTSVPTKEFLDNSRRFFEYLQLSTGRSIRVSDEMAAFSHIIHVSKAKSPSLRTNEYFGGKSDIVIMTRDGRSSVVSTMGFSIKSQFSSPPTLYNAGASTQFVYEIEGIDDAGMEEFNNLDKTVKRNLWTYASKLYKDRGWHATFIDTYNPITSQNLFLIRDSMPELVAWIYRRALLEDYPTSRDFTTLSHALEIENPLGYPHGWMYEKAIKDLLFASFSGMTGAVPWDGLEQVNGGYIVVMPDGSVLCYHANDREVFRDYLFTQTHIEYVSRNKFKWGSISKDSSGRYLLYLNGSFRFYNSFRDVRKTQSIDIEMQK